MTSEPVAVLHYVNSLSTGGAEKFVHELALAQARAGARVAVATFLKPHQVGDGEPVAAARQAELEAAGVACFATGRASRLLPPAGIGPLRRIAARVGAEVLHCHLLRAAGVHGLALPRLPAVLTHHNTPLPAPQPLFRLMAARIHTFVGISEASSAVLRGVTRRPVETVANGIDLSRFRPARPRGDGPVTILSVGNLRPQKNYSYLVDIAAALRERLPGRPLRFRVIGEGEERRRIERRIAAAGIGDTVRLLGTRSDVAAEMAGADIFLMTSAWEGMPISLIEAQASGLPAISTPVGNIPEMIEDGASGFLIPLGQPESAAERLAALVDDAALRRRFGARAHAASRAYGIGTARDAYERVYRNVCRDAGPCIPEDVPEGAPGSLPESLPGSLSGSRPRG